MSDIPGKLRDLHQLRQDEIITEEDYKTQKQQLLAQFSAVGTSADRSAVSDTDQADDPSSSKKQRTEPEAAEAPKPAAEPKTNVQKGQVLLNLRKTESQDVVQIKCKRGTTTTKVKAAYAAQMGLDTDKFRLVYDGTRIDYVDNLTIEQVLTDEQGRCELDNMTEEEMQEGIQIDVMLEMHGGGGAAGILRLNEFLPINKSPVST